MASKKLAKTDLSHSQKNASDVVSLRQLSDDTGSINSHSFSIGSDETRSILSHSQEHGLDETKSIYSRSVRYGSDETKSIDSHSLIYGSDETKSIDSRSLRHGSDETKSIDTRSVKYESDKTKMKTALGKKERRKKGTHALSSVFEMCDIHEGKLLDCYCMNHNVSVCSLCMELTHRSCRYVQPESAQDLKQLKKMSKQLGTLVIDGDNKKSKSTDFTTKADGEVGGMSAAFATKGGGEVGGKSADIAIKGGDEVGGKSADKATKGGKGGKLKN